MKAEEIFEKYHEFKVELFILDYEISYYKELNPDEVIEAMTFSRPQGERVQTSNISDKTARIALDYKETVSLENTNGYIQLLNRQRYIQDELKFFEYCLKKVKHGDIIYDLIIENMMWDEIEAKYGISRMTISRYKNMALKEINKLYETRNSLIANYNSGCY